MDIFFKNIYFWLVLGLILATQLKIKFSIFFSRQDSGNELAIRIYLFKNFLSLKLELPVIKMLKGFIIPDLFLKENWELTHPRLPVHKDKNRLSVNKIDWQKVLVTIIKVKNLVRLYRSQIAYLTRSTHCLHFEWHTEYGANDAATTGVRLGIIWFLKGILLAILENKIIFWNKNPLVEVIPNFNQPCLNVNFCCIFAIKLGHIIIVGIKVVGQWLKKGVKLSNE
ncbi:MAG TPA: DUF2953 domain-containing protein [Clostridia bacterium]|nr:DUF2953 domain-containing protein [Clostridia bacterium]